MAPKPAPRWTIGIALNVLLYLTALAILLFVASPKSGVEQVSYTDFKQMVRAGRIADVVVSEDQIRGTVRDTDRSVQTTRIDDPRLLDELELHAVKVTGRAANRGWIDLAGWVVPLLMMVAIWQVMRRRLNPGEGAVAFGHSRAKIYAEDDVKVTFADVAGIDEATEELREVVDFLQNPKKYTELGARIPKGVLLLGPPGTGKTLLARAVAGEARVPFFSLSGSEFVEMFVGVGAARVRDLFAQAEARAPCIVFIDELDALGKTRVHSPLGSHEEREQTLNQLLAEMDGFDPRKGVIVMAATNRPEILDLALLRPGRFDRHIVVDRPDLQGREAILRLHARSVKVAADVDLKVVAQRTTGFAGAELANLVNEATLLAARKNQRDVSMADFDEAIDRLLAGLKRRRVMSAREREVVACHEAGHAIVATVLPGVDPVHRISIVQRGIAVLGHTLQLPGEDRHLTTRQSLVNQLAVWLGGRAAEEIVFQDISTGAENDLLRATDLARSMVTEFGMSETLGPVAYTERNRLRFLDAAGTPSVPLAEETAREIDLEIKSLLVAARTRARSILTAQRHILDILTRRLIESEVVEGADVRTLVAEAPTAPRAA